MSFAELIGNTVAIRLLQQQVGQERVSHATLLTGTEGVGKFSLAMRFAQALVCGKPAQGEACGDCFSCQSFEKQSCPDCVVISPDPKTGSIGIDPIRELAKTFVLTPHSGRFKVAVLEDADRMTDQAANACLKLLEEPPEHSLLILTASLEAKLPATLLSRCHRVSCLPQGISAVKDWLVKGQGMSESKAQMLANASGGRVGMALALGEEEGLAARNEALDQILNALARNEVEVELGKQTREEILEALEWCASWWRDGLLLSLHGDSAWVIHQDRMKILEQQAKTTPPEIWLGRLDRTTRAQTELARSASPRVALAALLVGGAG